MPRGENWQDDMNAAGEVAAKDLDELFDSMSDEEKRGALKVVAWLDDNTAAAGYKRLCRALRAKK
jgi:hypothetical protein